MKHVFQPFQDGLLLLMSADFDKPNADKPMVDRLIDIAGEIFAAKGSSATVREICKAAGCSVAAVNYYFGDKQQLYIRCVQAACERKQKLFPMPEFSSKSDATDLLRQFLRTMASRMAAKSNVSWHNTLMLREVISPSAGVAEMLQAPFQKDFDLLQELLGAIVGRELDSAEMRRDLATQIVARCMFLRSGKHLRRIVGIASSKNEDPSKYADSICDSVLMQVNFIRHTNQLPPLAWTASNNTPASQTPIEG